MKHKFRLFTAVLAVMLCMMAFSVTAFADGGDYHDSELPPPETTETPEVPETPEATAKPLTPEGNMTLVDDINGDAAGDKQFIVVQSKGGNYFYIIIDKADEGNNTVHFLNQVDEADLLSEGHGGARHHEPAGPGGRGLGQDRRGGGFMLAGDKVRAAGGPDGPHGDTGRPAL